MGTERQIGEVRGLEGSGGFWQLSHTSCFAFYLLQALQESNKGAVSMCGALYLVSQPQGARTRCLVLGLLRTQGPCPPTCSM